MPNYLYEIADDIRSQLMLAEQSDDPTEAMGILQGLHQELEYRVESVAKRTIELKRLEESIDAEIERLKNAKKAAANRQVWLKSYIGMVLERAGIKRHDSPIVKMRRQKAAPSLAVSTEIEALIEQGVDLRQIMDPEFVRVIPERYELDRRAVIDAAKAGKPIPDGMVIEEGREFVVIW